MHYWNKLPEHVKDKNSVNSSKNGLDQFRTNGIKNGLSGQFWELSNDIFVEFNINNIVKVSKVKWRTGVAPSGGYLVGAIHNFLSIYTLSLLSPFVFNKLEE